MRIKSTYHDLWVLITKDLCSGTTLLGEGRKEGEGEKKEEKNKNQGNSPFFFFNWSNQK